MKVRTKRKHLNGYGDAPLKNPGKVYELPALAAAPLIDAGLVEAVDAPVDDADQVDADDAIEPEPAAGGATD